MNAALERRTWSVAELALENDDSFSLPVDFYTEPAILALEEERIFARAWNFVGYTAEVASSGDFLAARVAGEGIAVVRGDDSVLRAFYNVCSHRGHPLLCDRGNARRIVCPYHGWAYELSGALRHARNGENVPGFDRGDYGLKPVRVESFCGMVFVNLSDSTPSLRECYPGLAEQILDYCPDPDALRLVHRAPFRIAANWKHVVDNYNENYHTPIVHAALDKVLDPDAYRVTVHENFISHSSPTRRGDGTGFEVDRSYPRHLNWWMWPNLCLMSIPGGGFRVLHIVPDGPEATRETYDFVLPPGEVSEAQWRQIRYAADVVNPEDVAVVEQIQQGMKSRAFRRSRYMVDVGRTAASEHALPAFKKLVLAALRAD